MTALRLLVTGLGLTLLSFLLVTAFFAPWIEPSLLSVRGLLVLVLALTGTGLVVSAGLVSALTAPPRTPVAEPAVDHYAG